MNSMLSRSLAVLFVSLLSFTSLATLNVKAQKNESGISLAMTKEYIAYTITNKNGSYWAKVKGTYPIRILNSANSQINLPMFYPTPPNTKNIHITLNEKELSWTNYTNANSEALHETAIGNWSMIRCLLENVTDSFLLEIQYEHPIQQIDRSYIFLYDLNINPYLSIESSNSTAHFTINFETNISDFYISTTQTNSNWIPINYNLEETNSIKIITTQIVSEYLEPLVGDLVISFNDPKYIEISSFLIISSICLISIIGFGISYYLKVRGKSRWMPYLVPLVPFCLLLY